MIFVSWAAVSYKVKPVISFPLFEVAPQNRGCRLVSGNTLALISRLSYVFFLPVFFCYQAPNSLGDHRGEFSLHSSHQRNIGLSLRKPLSIIPGNTPTA